MQAHYTFFLVNPGNPANVGATARALKTMGHERLVLVNPCEEYLGGQALALAHKSESLLKNAKIYESLSQAIEGEKVELVVGCTSRHRRLLREYIDCRELQEFIYHRHQVSRKIAIVFGSERNGLSKSDIELCDVLSTIPAAHTQPSLNLSQSVMIYSFLLSQSNKVQTADWRLNSKTINEKEYVLFRQAVGGILIKLGLEKDGKFYQKALDRIAFIPGSDLRILQAIRRRIEALV